MDIDSRSPSPGHEEDEERRSAVHAPVQGIGTVAAAQRALQEEGPRNRSPSPLRALYRSTTGKGVAFTDEDVTFLVKMLAYRKFVHIPASSPLLLILVLLQSPRAT